MKRRLILLAFFIICILPITYAIGLRSNDLHVNINFKPNFQGTYHYSIVTSDAEPTDVEFYVENDNNDGTNSDLTPYLILSNTRMTVLGNQEPYFTVTVKLPNKIDEPGIHKLHVGVREATPYGGGIAVRTGIEALFWIHVPFEGTYLKYWLSAESVNENEPIPVSISLNNLGTDPIIKLYADIELLDLKNITVSRARTDIVGLDSQESKVLKSSIKTEGIPPGSYSVKATIIHDGEEDVTTRDVKIGQLNFVILNNTEELAAGKINQFNITVESQWADPIADVYATVQIGNGAEMRTPSDSFKGFEIKTLAAFVDASELNTGTHNTTIKLYFKDKTIVKNTPVRVIREGILEFAGNLSVTNAIFLLAVTLIIIVNMILFVVLLRKKGEHEIKK